MSETTHEPFVTKKVLELSTGDIILIKAHRFNPAIHAELDRGMTEEQASTNPEAMSVSEPALVSQAGEIITEKQEVPTATVEVVEPPLPVAEPEKVDVVGFPCDQCEKSFKTEPARKAHVTRDHTKK